MEEQNGNAGMGELGGEEVRDGFELNTLYNVGNSYTRKKRIQKLTNQQIKPLYLP